jgi:hypothetical protein
MLGDITWRLRIKEAPITPRNGGLWQFLLNAEDAPSYSEATGDGVVHSTRTYLDSYSNGTRRESKL